MPGPERSLSCSFNLGLHTINWTTLSRKPLLLLCTINTCGSRWRLKDKAQPRGGEWGRVVCGDPLVPGGMFLCSISVTSSNPEDVDFLPCFCGWPSVLVTPFADQNTEAQGSQGISQAHRTHSRLLPWQVADKASCKPPGLSWWIWAHHPPCTPVCHQPGAPLSFRVQRSIVGGWGVCSSNPL